MAKNQEINEEIKARSRKAAKPKKKSLIIIAIILSIILYAAGLLSGLSFSKFMEKNIEQKTKADINDIVDYVKSLDSSLQSIQIQERFVQGLNEKDTCKFADVYFSQINQNLNYFWKVLPARLEEYERTVELTPEYLELKRQYTKLSLRAWIISKDNYQKCKTRIIPVLYLYSTNCADCVKQGEVLDDVKNFLVLENKSLIVFTVDYDYNEPALDLVKKYYDINVVPALVINDEALQGRLFSENEIILRVHKS
ncbi:hypothetical protein JW756_02090 [Candidatus Woesearchaeota archaeon]|nr:hypothetical protein [Candidatus Woesearchaeota archaeon]